MLTGAQINEVSVQALSLVFSGSMPAMIACAVAGVTIALLQALTQVQDQGLPTAVKFFAVMGVLYMTYIGISTSVMAYADYLYEMIASI